MDTKKKLIAYQISGQTVGIDIKTWVDSDLNGNEPFKIILSGDTIPSGYTDINIIEYWDQFAPNVANDYAVIRFAIKEIVDIKNWSGLTNTEKDLTIKYYSYSDPVDAVIYLMTVKGMTQGEAELFVLRSWHKHHLRNIVAYTQRWNYAKYSTLLYLNRYDAEDLFYTVKTLIDLYIETGIIGVDFNYTSDGIIDYIYSIHGFTGQGLEENNYNLLQGTWADFKDALNIVVVCGIYEMYDDI
jgi:hypothetical protein